MKVILVKFWSGNFGNVTIDDEEVNENYYIGDTVNGVRKYKWNIGMWVNSWFSNDWNDIRKNWVKQK